jgi:hypothetical protein
MNGHGRVTVTLDTDPHSGIEPIVPPELGILAERWSLDPEDARALLGGLRKRAAGASKERRGKPSPAARLRSRSRACGGTRT